MTIQPSQKTGYILAWVLGCILVYSFFVFFSWKQIPVGDQVFDLVSADSLAKKTHTEYLEITSRAYPPAYMLAVSSIMKGFSVSCVKAAKLLGIACFPAALLLIYLIILQVAPAGYGHAAAILAAYLYALDPAVIQGSQVLKQDTSILTVAMLLFVFAFLKQGRDIRLPGAVFLGLCFSVVMCAKSTTALAVPVALGSYLVFQKKYKESLLCPGTVLAAGIFFLLFFWFILRQVYPYPFAGFPFFCHFERIFGEYGIRLVKTFAEQVQEWAKCSIIVLWVSPYFVLLWLMAAMQRIRTYRVSGYLQPRDFIGLLAFIILSGYLVAGGLAHGFPRYQFPAISLCVVYIALFCAENLTGNITKRYLLFGGALLLVSTVYNLEMVGDSIYDVYYLLRFNAAFPELAVTDAGSRFLWQMFSVLCLLFFPFLACRRLFPELPAIRKWIVILVPLAIGANLSQDILNARAPYQTGYTYGGTGAKEIIGLLSGELGQNKKVLAPDDISFHLPGIILDKRMHDWTSPEVFTAIIKEKDPDLVVYGLSSNSVIQYQKTFNNSGVRAFLKERFPVRKDIGSYTVWMR